jgi:O-antigen ligase
MSPSIATPACLALIFWLLYRDAKTHPRVSVALWVPTIWVGIMSSKPVVYWFESKGGNDLSLDTYLDGNPVDRVILLALLGLAFGILMQRRLRWDAVFHNNKWLCAFYVYLIFCVLWSDYPFVSFKRYVKDVGNLLMILVILTDREPDEALRRTFVRCAYILIPLSVLFIKYYPDVGRYYHQWTYETCYSGVTNNKNSLGRLAMVSGLFLLWSMVDTQKMSGLARKIKNVLPELLGLAMSLWLLKIAGSSTALGSFLVASVVYFGYRMSREKARLNSLIWCTYAIAIFSAVVLLVPGLRAIAAESLGRDATLTTRTDIWEAVLDMGTNPLLGTGYASVWLTTDGWKLAQELDIPHAHNGYLETYLNSGFIGVFLLIGLLVVAAKRAARLLAVGGATGPLYMSLLLCGIVYNYTEVTFNNNNVVGLLVWLVAFQFRPVVSPVTAAERASEAETVVELNMENDLRHGYP